MRLSIYARRYRRALATFCEATAARDRMVEASYLAPDGVYTDGVCYHTPGEPLPHLFTLTLAGGYFLLHFP